MPRTWPRILETEIPVLGTARLELLPVAGRVLLTAATPLLRTPALALDPEECLTLARELMHAASEAHRLDGGRFACQEHTPTIEGGS